jgi:hypothetical protein
LPAASVQAVEAAAPELEEIADLPTRDDVPAE